MKHKPSIIDLGLLAAMMGVATYLAYSVNIFVDEPGTSDHHLRIETDELMLLGALLMLGLLIFSVRRFMAQKREIVRRLAAEQRAHELAYQDPLTGLPNRRQFNEALDVAIKSPAGSQTVHALFLLDLNGFKQINDVHGHGVGDEVLIVVAQRLLQSVRAGDLVARIGGDEFAVLALNLMGPDAAAAFAQRIVTHLEEPVLTGAARHVVGAGIGISLIEGQDREEIVRKADMALYRAKAERRSAFRFFAEEMDALVRENDALERDLRAALADGRITPAFRPTIDLRTQQIVSFEVTPRWMLENGDEMPTMRFVPIAEETGLIHSLAEAMLYEGCKAAAAWPQAVSLAVEVYSTQLSDAALATRILAVLARTGLPPARLEVSITEGMLVQNLGAIKSAFETLHAAGVKIALSNFGTGYSTLFHLREFRLDRIKIDKSFLEGDDSDTRRILSALAGLGQGLGVEVGVEGTISRESRLDMLVSGIQQSNAEEWGTGLTGEQASAALAAARTAGQRRQAG